MIKRLLILLCLFFMLFQPLYVNALDFKYVEVFDPKQDKVVKVVQSNPEIQNMVASWIQNIHGIYSKNNPITDDGYAIKIPLDPTVKVNCNSLNAIVSEFYIIIPEKDPPFYMIFEDETHLSCYPFNGDIDMLSNFLDFNLSSTH